MNEPKRRKWFHLAFSLKTLLGLVLLAAIPMGWVACQIQIVREREAILGEVRRADPAHFRYVWIDQDQKYLDDSITPFQGFGRQYDYARIGLVRRFCGDKSCIELDLPSSLEAESIGRAETCFPEAELFIYGLLEGEFFHYRDSLYKPPDERNKNAGKVFKTGKSE